MSAHLTRRRGSRKRTAALGDFIRRDVEQLRNFAQSLNGGPAALPADADRRLVDAVERWAAPPAVTAVVDAVLGTPYPAAVPTEAAQRFNALADGTPLYYVAELEGGEVRPDDMAFRFAFSDREHLQWVYLQSPTAQGVWVAWLAFFLDNPQRERLRRCQSCRRWFVDETRNKSARRCSRACTIAWSNRQRGQRKKRGGRR